MYDFICIYKMYGSRSLVASWYFQLNSYFRRSPVTLQYIANIKVTEIIFVKTLWVNKLHLVLSCLVFFDTVDHSKLLQKLRFRSIWLSLVMVWKLLYLSGRCQRVTVHGVTSTSLLITSESSLLITTESHKVHCQLPSSSRCTLTICPITYRFLLGLVCMLMIPNCTDVCK